MKSFDVVVIGSGPGGYVCAIRCAQLGMKTALVEKYDSLGGTCLNVGCIPSKALLDSSEHFHNAKQHFATHGIEIPAPKANIVQMMKRKSEVIEQTVGGIDFLMKKNAIEVLHGVGSIVDKNTVSVSGKENEILTVKNIVIATGSKPTVLPGITADKKRIITSTEALSLQEIPKTMAVVGGGVIGLELGSVYARLGTEVTVIEYADSLLSSMDASLGKEMKKIMTKHLKMKFQLKHKVVSAKNTGKSVEVEVENMKKGESETTAYDYCLIAVGRSPYTEGLGLENVGITPVERGMIPTNEHLQTSSSNIYAIGDVVAGAMLAHKAEEEGVYVAEHMMGQKPHIDHNLIPGVVYTWPEAASVGKTEQQLKEAGIAYKTGSFPFKASGRARASMDTDGFVRVYADQETDEILGVQMIGPRVADMIAQAVTAMEFRASAEDIARITHAHPTFTEAFKEAALDATAKRALHI